MTALLDGIRVLDFTWVISGPQCTAILADFGAEVIKAEWPHHLDGLRFRVQPPGSDPESPEQSGLWGNLNRNKRSITLNMRHPQGAEVALQLIAKCDVLVENFSPGVLESWGLPWELLQEVNPRLIYLSMSGFGRGGPNERYVVFAPVMQALSGLHAMTGRPSSEPAGMGFSYADHVGGYFGALSVLAALHERDATGHGAMIDLGQVEGSVALTSTALLDYQVNGRPFVGWGNVPYGTQHSPAGFFRCVGQDSWCAISVRTDEEWRALTEVMANPELGNDPRFATVHGRAAHRALLEREVTAWTEKRTREDVAAALDDADVPCTPMQDAVELLNDEKLHRHGHFQRTDHPFMGEHLFQMGAIRSEDGPVLRSPGPLLGEANDYVYGQLLGFSADEISAFRDDAII